MTLYYHEFFLKKPSSFPKHTSSKNIKITVSKNALVDKFDVTKKFGYVLISFFFQFFH